MWKLPCNFIYSYSKCFKKKKNWYQSYLLNRTRCSESISVGSPNAYSGSSWITKPLMGAKRSKIISAPLMGIRISWRGCVSGVRKLEEGFGWAHAATSPAYTRHPFPQRTLRRIEFVGSGSRDKYWLCIGYFLLREQLRLSRQPKTSNFKINRDTKYDWNKLTTCCEVCEKIVGEVSLYLYNDSCYHYFERFSWIIYFVVFRFFIIFDFYRLMIAHRCRNLSQWQ